MNCPGRQSRKDWPSFSRKFHLHKHDLICKLGRARARANCPVDCGCEAPRHATLSQSGGVARLLELYLLPSWPRRPEKLESPDSRCRRIGRIGTLVCGSDRNKICGPYRRFAVRSDPRCDWCDTWSGINGKKGKAKAGRGRQRDRNGNEGRRCRRLYGRSSCYDHYSPRARAPDPNSRGIDKSWVA